jgi:signal transduction histidine kinase
LLSSLTKDLALGVIEFMTAATPMSVATHGATPKPTATSLSAEQQPGFETVLRDALHAQTMVRCRSAFVHDVKSATQAIYWAIDLLKKTVASSPIEGELRVKQEKYLGWCKQELENLQRVVQRVLSETTPEDGDREVLDLSALLMELGKLVGDEAALIEVELQLDLPADSHVEGFRNQLRQLFLGLMLDALDAMPHGGKLRIALKTEGADQHIRISDNRAEAPLIDGSNLSTLDFTAQPVRKGIALHVVRSIAQAHGGNIHSDYEQGRGVQVDVRLPRSELQAI